MAWLRLYDNLLDDPKIQMLSDRAFRMLINLWCLAKRRGGILPADPATLAFSLRWSEGRVRDTLQALISAKLIDRTEDGLEPHDWHVHQYDSDSAAERMRRYRDRLKENALRNSDAIEPDTESETEQKKEETMSADADGVPSSKPKAQENRYTEDFEQFWTAYGKRENSPKPKAFKAWKRTASIRPPLPELLRCVAAYLAFLAVETKKRRSEFPKKHHVTWLNDNSWEPHMAAPSPVLSLEAKRARDAERAATDQWEAELEAARIRQGA